ncbi:right-handed parallel beta-helix repeat-containing protein [Kiritimatiellaeota bacterium B1221]|nr:right-handed parallel beta-helix repeat-containing protein [Kiritimatiellaeota bacterium B1221]
MQIELPAGNVSEAQRFIDRARRDHPEAILILKVGGDLWVGAQALKLPSRSVLLLSSDAGVRALADASASSLIQMEDAASVAVVSVGPGLAVLDGGGEAVAGIRVRGGKRMIFDRLLIRGCKGTGLDYAGADGGAVNEATSMTGCDFEGNGVGLRVKNTAGFICQNNIFREQSDVALDIESKSSVIAQNRFEKNGRSLRCGSEGSVITRNVFGDGRVLELTPGSNENLISENVGSLKGQSLQLEGKGQQFFRNRFAEAVVEHSGGGDVYWVGNEGVRIPEADHMKFFHPPTLSRPHRDPLIVAGMGRFDLEMRGGNRSKNELPRDLNEVQIRLDEARLNHADDVIVLWLQGEFVSRKPEGLQLPPDVCLILEGRIRADPGTELEPAWKADAPLTQVIRVPDQGVCAISGGTLDAGRQVFHPLNAAGGAVVLVEGMNLTAGARDGVNTKSRGQAPLFLYRNRVFGNRYRGIWAHVAQRIHAIDNVCVGNGMDGIDLDAYASGSTALFNVSGGNGRHGVFVEEAVKGMVVAGNVLSGNQDSGVHVWNEAVEGNTGGNVIALNDCVGNARGLSVGGRSEEKRAEGNFFFHNRCRENRVNGIWAGNVHAKGNYFSQNVLERNLGDPVLEPEGAVYFNVGGGGREK